MLSAKLTEGLYSWKSSKTIPPSRYAIHLPLHKGGGVVGSFLHRRRCWCEVELIVGTASRAVCEACRICSQRLMISGSTGADDIQ